MTFLNATINNLEESKIYHEEQARLLQEEIDQASLSASYGDDAVSSVEAAIENIDPKHLELLKEHLLSLFDNESKLEDLNSRALEEVPQEICSKEQEEVSNHVIDSQTDPLESVKSNPKYGKAGQRPLSASGTSKLTEEIYYDKETQTCYLGFSNRNRATEYGYHLLEIHKLFEGKHGVDKPVVVTHCKWELVIQNITESNAAKLKELNLKKVLSHKDNQAVTAVWKTGKVEPEEVLTEDVNIYIPKETVKKSEGVMEEEFPPAPYTELPLTEVEFGDVITSSPHGRSAYMVKEHAGEFVMAECLYHNSLPGRVGENYSFSKIYLVEKCS